MAGSFFPFTKELAENENFKNMPPTHRLFFFLLISEFNLRGQFYKSDIEAAVTINTSLDTIRRARRELKKLQWITVRPGFLERGKRPVATTYLHIAFSQVQEGEFFAPIHRYPFETLLHRLRKGILGHKEVLLFFYVCFFDAKYREDKDFFISKRELVDITGMPDAPAALLRLNEDKIFGNNTTLLEVIDIYHKIKILKHWGFADPEENENNRKLAEEYKNDIRQRVDAAKKSQAKKKGKLQREDLIPLFEKLYQKTHGKSCRSGYIQEEKLFSLAEQYGPDVIAKGIEAYFAASKVLNKGAKTRTLANFLEYYKYFIKPG